MYFDSPQVTDFSEPLPVAESAYPRTSFWRTTGVLALHALAQIALCIAAQVDSHQTQDFCALLTCASTFIHIILLCSFAGMVIRSRFLFSWSFGVAIISFCFSLFLCYLMVGHRNNEFLGPMFGVMIVHSLILCAGAVCLVFWPIFRWPYELTRDITPQEASGAQQKVQFSIKRLLYIIFLAAMVCYCLKEFNGGLLNRRLADAPPRWAIPVIASLNALAVIYLILRPKFKFIRFIHVNILSWIALVLLFLWGSYLPVPQSGTTGLQPVLRVNREYVEAIVGFFSLMAHLCVSAFLYRWAGWRLVRFAGHNRSVYHRVYRYIMSSH